MRPDGRRADELRPLSLESNWLEQPHGSVLYAQGKTKVLCTASIEDGVPRWLVGKGIEVLTGLLTGLVNFLPSVWQWFLDLPGQILTWLGDAGEWLVECIEVPEQDLVPAAIVDEQVAAVAAARGAHAHDTALERRVHRVSGLAAG